MRRSEQTGHTVKLLHIDSSILDGNSASRALTAGIVARWRRAMPELQVLHRDLAGTHALSHLDGASLAKSDAAEAARRCGAHKLWLMHHAPDRTDDEIDAMAVAAAAAFKGAVFPAVETMTETLHE